MGLPSSACCLVGAALTGASYAPLCAAKKTVSARTPGPGGEENDARNRRSDAQPEVLDPQGKAVEGALANMGLSAVAGVRVGKRIVLEIADGVSRTRLNHKSSKLLTSCWQTRLLRPGV